MLAQPLRRNYEDFAGRAKGAERLEPCGRERMDILLARMLFQRMTYHLLQQILSSGKMVKLPQTYVYGPESGV